VDAAAAEALARHGEAVATVRDYQQRTGAVRVVVLVDRGPEEPPLMIDCDEEQAVEITDRETVATIPADAGGQAPPRPLPDIRHIPASAIEMDLATGDLQAPLGAIEHVAQTLEALARAFGKRSVATAELATRDPETTITLAARDQEPAVLAAGDYEYTLRQHPRSE
jgi:hypothetical protein